MDNVVLPVWGVILLVLSPIFIEILKISYQSYRDAKKDRSLDKVEKYIWDLISDDSKSHAIKTVNMIFDRGRSHIKSIAVSENADNSGMAQRTQSQYIFELTAKEAAKVSEARVKEVKEMLDILSNIKK